LEHGFLLLVPAIVIALIFFTVRGNRKHIESRIDK